MTIREEPEHDSCRIDWRDCPHVERDPEIMTSGRCFEGTRLPVSTRFGNLGSGLTVPEFVEQFPSARTEHVNAVLVFLAQRLDATSTR